MRGGDEGRRWRGAPVVFRAVQHRLADVDERMYGGCGPAHTRHFPMVTSRSYAALSDMRMRKAAG